MRRVFLMFCLILSSFFMMAQTSIQVQTHNVVGEDEQFTVSFIIEGNRPSDFSWNHGDDFDLLWGPQQGRSSSVQIINGKRTESSQTTYSYVLRPVKPGKFTLPKASATVGGKEIYSSSVTVEVVANGGDRTSSNAGARQQSASSAASAGRETKTSPDVSGKDIFMVLNLSRNDVVVGEPVKATLKLYQRADIAGFEGADFPDFDGFWSQETVSPQQIQFVRESYGGQIYNSALLREYVLIPQHSGDIRIDPAELVCLVNVRISSGGSSVFDGFFDDYTTVRKKVTSNPVTVKVRQLPGGAPASFAGGVGRFNISASLSTDSLMTHDAATLNVRISGEGNISLLEAPKVKLPLDMESYDPKVVSNVSASGVSGSRTYEYPFIPRSAGDFVIEPIEYSYYDVDQNRYVTLKTPAMPITVIRGNETASDGIAMPGISRQGVRDLDKDIRYINVKDSGLKDKGAYLLGSSLFWIIMAVLSLGAILALILVRRTSARRADVVGTKNRKASKVAQKRLSVAKSLLKKNESLLFYAELHKALLGYVSDKLNMSAADMSKENMAAALTGRGVDEAAVQGFMDILDSCEYARYSPDSGSGSMASDYERAADIISSIDSEIKSGKGMSMKSMAVLLLMLALPMTGMAAESARADSLWNAGNAAYSQGLWDEAIDAYEEISDMGLESAALYCNTGNAWYKAGNTGKAILNYERALRLDPSYEDAEFNLGLLQERIQDRIEPVPEFFLKAWFRSLCYMMGSDAWTVLFIILFAVFLALALVFILARTAAWKRVGFFCGLVVVLMMSGALSFAIWQKNDRNSVDAAVVMRPVTSVKSSPTSDNSTDLFILHEGTKVTVLDVTDGWVNVSLADGRQGWMKVDDLEMI